VFLGDCIEKRSRRIGSISLKHGGVQNQLCVEVYCGVQPRLFAVDHDSGLVDRDPPRLRSRRVATAVSDSMYALVNRLKRGSHAENPKNCFCCSKRKSRRVEPEGERPDGRPQNAVRSGVRARRFASR
jgi:hypothetical protein